MIDMMEHQTTGSYDNNQPRIEVIRVKAIAAALKFYGLPPQQERQLCQCPACQARRSLPKEFFERGK